MIVSDYFCKGWTNAALHESFIQAVKTGDCYAAASAVRSEGADRKPVDSYIHANRMPSNPYQNVPRGHDLRSDSQIAEVKRVFDLAEQRDEKLEDIDGTYPEGFRTLSWFLRDTKVPRYAKGKNYMTTQKSFDKVMAGDQPKPITSGNATLIRTGRDAASYVHSDDPYDTFVNAAFELIDLGVPQRLNRNVNDHDGEGQSRFMVFGKPYIKGLLSYVGLHAGHVSFKNKWTLLKARPEQLYAHLNLGFLPQCYPEGSPMHPSKPAMHSFLSLALGYAVLELFDHHFELPSGRTVKEEVNLLADNVGYFRVIAGVHYESDHDDAKEAAKHVAETIVSRFLR